MLFLCIGLVALAAILAPTGWRLGAYAVLWFVTLGVCIGEAVTGRQKCYRLWFRFHAWYAGDLPWRAHAVWLAWFSHR